MFDSPSSQTSSMSQDLKRQDFSSLPEKRLCLIRSKGPSQSSLLSQHQVSLRKSHRQSIFSQNRLSNPKYPITYARSNPEAASWASTSLSAVLATIPASLPAEPAELPKSLRESVLLSPSSEADLPLVIPFLESTGGLQYVGLLALHNLSRTSDKLQLSEAVVETMYNLLISSSNELVCLELISIYQNLIDADEINEELGSLQLISAFIDKWEQTGEEYKYSAVLLAKDIIDKIGSNAAQLVIEHGIVDVILDFLEKEDEFNMLCILGFFASYWELMKSNERQRAAKITCHHIMQKEEIDFEYWLVLSFFCNYDIQDVEEYMLDPSFLQKLDEKSSSWADWYELIPIIEIILSIIKMDEFNTKIVHFFDIISIVQTVFNMLAEKDIYFKNRAVYFLERLMVKLPSEIMTDLIDKEYIKNLIERSKSEGDRTLKGITKVVLNLLTYWDEKDIAKVINDQMYKLLVNSLDIKSDPKLIFKWLKTLSRLFDWDIETISIDSLNNFQELNGLDLVENLQNHENNEVYQAAVQFLERYFTNDENIFQDDTNWKNDINLDLLN